MLTFACIAPHGGVSIERLGSPAAARAAGTRRAMAELRAGARAAAVDTWIVISPHGVRVDGAMAVSDAEWALATLEPEGEGGEAISLRLPLDRAIAQALAVRSAERGVPAAKVNYGASYGPHCTYPMDWGGAIPLWFLGAHEDGSRTVQVVPSRSLTWEDMVRFGEAVADVAEASERRVGLVASSDLAHAHDAAGPYGFDEAAAVYDRAVRDAVEAGDLMHLLAFDPHLVAAAKPDGQWQILVLAGALARVPMRPRLLSYEVPTYFGMLTAVCEAAG